MHDKSKNNPKISIITVCYNEEGGIDDTCKSIISQSYNNYEWIIVDGGSTDRTLEILDKYKSHSAVFISEKDNGVYSAMNKGIRIAKGEYVLFLNGGDYLYDNKILKEIFHKNLYVGDVLYGNCCVLMKNGERIMSDFSKKISKYYFLNICINHQSTFIRRDLFERYGLYDENYRILADFEKWIKFSKNKVNFQKIPFVVSNFKNFDGLSSDEKMESLLQKEKKNIIKKYFNVLEIGFFKVAKFCKVFFYKFLNRIKNLFKKILFIIFSPREFISKYWGRFLNSPLRRPARRIWYFIGRKNINIKEGKNKQ